MKMKALREGKLKKFRCDRGPKYEVKVKRQPGNES